MKKIKNFFINPAKAFQGYKEDPKFALNFIIAAVGTFIATFVTFIATKDQLREIAIKSAEKSSHGNQQAIDMTVNLMVSPVMHVISSLLAGGMAIGIIALLAFVYWLLVKIFRGTISYAQAISVYSLSYVTIVIGEVCRALYTLIFGQNITTAKVNYLNTFLSYFSIFKIWQIVLLVFGISVVAANISKKKAIAIVLVVTFLGLLFTLGSVAFADLMSTFSKNMSNI